MIYRRLLFDDFESLLHIGQCIIEDKLKNNKIVIIWYEMKVESSNITMDNVGTKRKCFVGAKNLHDLDGGLMRMNFLLGHV